MVMFRLRWVKELFEYRLVGLNLRVAELLAVNDTLHWELGRLVRLKLRRFQLFFGMWMIVLIRA